MASFVPGSRVSQPGVLVDALLRAMRACKSESPVRLPYCQPGI